MRRAAWELFQDTVGNFQSNAQMEAEGGALKVGELSKGRGCSEAVVSKTAEALISKTDKAMEKQITKNRAATKFLIRKVIGERKFDEAFPDWYTNALRLGGGERGRGRG